MIIKIEEPRLVTNIDASDLESKRNVNFSLFKGLFSYLRIQRQQATVYSNCTNTRSINKLPVRTLRFRQWTNTITRDCNTVT